MSIWGFNFQAIVVLAVTGETVMADLAVADLAVADLAVAVGVGVVISALVFAWQHAKHLDIHISVEEDGSKTYAVKGSLFFASVAQFSSVFTPRDESSHITIDFSQARVMDHSAIAAIDSVRNRYQQLGKQVTLLHVAPECRTKLERASNICDSKVVFAAVA